MIFHTIPVKYQELTIREAIAESAITPGELLEITTNKKVVAHSVASGVLPGKLIALQTQTPDAKATAQIDIDYDIGDTVYYAVGKPGEVYNMWLAAGETVVKGVTQLQSDGAGALKAVTVTSTTLTNSIVGVAAQDLTAGVSRARCLVEIV